MRICAAPPYGVSKAMHRVAAALERHAPRSVKVERRPDLADFVILHVIDYNGVPEAIQHCKELGQRYAIIQYCMRSTSRPNTKDWAEEWKDCCVWSYYDLDKMCKDDGASPIGNFYCAPLGADAAFSMNRLPPRYKVVTSGYVAESESVQSVAQAVRDLGDDARMFHLGPDLKLGCHVISKLGIPDAELAEAYNSAEFVSGLRRCEGFELPIVEGLFCGARPITFDQPHYRKWFNAFAEFIPEGAPEDVTIAMLDIFRRGPRPVTEGEVKHAAEIFNWHSIASTFWERAL